MPSLEKTKFGRKATENVKSICSSNEEIDLETILIGTNPISLNYSTTSLTLPVFFKLKEMEESLVEIKQKQPTADEGCIYKELSLNLLKKADPKR